MKHGRRHNKLKEQAYLARKRAEGYGRPYRSLPLEDAPWPGGEAEPEPVPREEAEDAPLSLGDAINRRSKNALRRAGLKDL